MSKVRPTRLVRTCMACPSQWEGTLEDGRAFYVRYRYGQGYFSTGLDVDDAVFGDTVCEFAPDGAHEFDGDMTDATMMALTADKVDWSLVAAARPRGADAEEGET